jgi:hypothetical protein
MSARVRALAVLGAYLSLAAHLSGLAHVVAVRHATCPSHGEMIHADGQAASAEAARADRSWTGDRAAASGEGDHCRALLVRRRDALLGAPDAVAPLALPVVARLAAPAAEPPPPAVPVYRLAPKTPPPLAAAA